MEKYLTPRPGDEKLDKPPADVIISLFGISKANHWSECIVKDNRPVEAENKEN